MILVNFIVCFFFAKVQVFIFFGTVTLSGIFCCEAYIFSQFKIWFMKQRVKLWHLLYRSLQTVQNTIGTLVRLVPDVLLPEMINHFCSCLDNPALLTVTHMDYAIMNTLEGELWDKSVLQK